MFDFLFSEPRQPWNVVFNFGMIFPQWENHELEDSLEIHQEKGLDHEVAIAHKGALLWWCF